FGRLIGIRDPFLHSVVPKVIDQMGGAYPGLVQKRELILKTVRMEEQQFNTTLEQGMRLLETAFAGAASGTVPGDQAFRLYDTYGFPLELTREMAEERGLQVEEAGFNAAMEVQKSTARRHRAASHAEERALGFDIQTQFVGYEALTALARARAIL